MRLRFIGLALLLGLPGLAAAQDMIINPAIMKLQIERLNTYLPGIVYFADKNSMNAADANVSADIGDDIVKTATTINQIRKLFDENKDALKLPSNASADIGDDLIKAAELGAIVGALLDARGEMPNADANNKDFWKEAGKVAQQAIVICSLICDKKP